MPAPHDRRRILDPSGRPISVGRISPEVDALHPDGWVHDPANPTHLDWHRFADWRRTHTPSRDHDDPIQRIEDLDQATHEAVAAAAGLADWLIANGLAGLLRENIRVRRGLLLAIGRVLFAASWVGDCWHLNLYLSGGFPAPDALVDRALGDGDERASAARQIGALAAEGRPFTEEEAEGIAGVINLLALQINTQAGRLADCFRLARWHRQPIDPRLPAGRLGDITVHAALLLAMANLPLSEALARVVAHLDDLPRGVAFPAPAKEVG